MQHACTCNPLMHHNIIITAVHDAHTRSVGSLALASVSCFIRTSLICVLMRMYGIPAAERATFQRNIEEGLGCVASRLSPRCAWLVCALAAECETPTALHQSATASRWRNAETPNQRPPNQNALWRETLQMM